MKPNSPASHPRSSPVRPARLSAQAETGLRESLRSTLRGALEILAGFRFLPIVRIPHWGERCLNNVASQMRNRGASSGTPVSDTVAT